jgi:chromosome segregation ATPase
MRTHLCLLMERSLARWVSNVALAALHCRMSSELHETVASKSDAWQQDSSRLKAVEATLESERKLWAEEQQHLDSDNCRLKQELRELREQQDTQQDDFEVMIEHTKQVQAELEQAHVDREQAEEQVAVHVRWAEESSQHEQTKTRADMQQAVNDLEQLRAELRSKDQELSTVQRDAIEQAQKSESAHAEMTQDLRDQTQELHDKEEMLEEVLLQQQNAEESQMQLDQTRAELNELKESSELEQMQMAVEMEELDMEKEELIKQLRSKEDHFEKTRSDALDQASQMLEGELSKVKAVEATLESERRLWAEEQQHLDSDNCRLKQELKTKESVAEQLEALTDERNQLELALGERDVLIAEQQAENEELHDELESAETCQWSAESEREQWAAEVEAFVVERGQMKQALDTQVAGAAQLQRELQQCQTQLSEARADQEKAEGMVAEKFKHFQQSSAEEQQLRSIRLSELQEQKDQLSVALQSSSEHKDELRQLHVIQKEDVKNLRLELQQAREAKEKAERMVAEKFTHFQETIQEERDQQGEVLFDLEEELCSIKDELKSALSSKKSFIEELHQSKTAHDAMHRKMLADRADTQLEMTQGKKAERLVVSKLRQRVQLAACWSSWLLFRFANMRKQKGCMKVRTCIRVVNVYHSLSGHAVTR